MTLKLVLLCSLSPVMTDTCSLSHRAQLVSIVKSELNLPSLRLCLYSRGRSTLTACLLRCFTTLLEGSTRCFTTHGCDLLL